MINAPDAIFVKRHVGPSGYHDEVFHDDDHVVRTLTKILDDAVGVAPQARPGRGPAGRAARQRRPAAHRARRRRPRRPRAGQHPQVHRRRLHAASTSWSTRDMLDAPVAEFLRACVRGPAVDRLRRRARLGQDDAAVVLRGRARPGAARRHRRGGLRGRRPAAERGQHADPAGARPTAPRSTCAGSSPASCAWRPTSPSSARSATARRCRCCSRCRRA